jgi:hypothetical protein
MDKLRLGWKLVKVRDNKFVSAMCRGAAVEYSFSHSRSRPVIQTFLCGPLAVFNTKRNAETFLKLEQQCNPNLEGIKFHIFPCAYERAAEKHLWSGGSLKKYNLPKGTDFAERVLLLHEVEY